MNTWKLVKLNFGSSPAHFGDNGIGIEETSERVRSDSLFSAWVSAYARLFGFEAVEELLQRFLHPFPPARMSSTFIYRENSDRTIYYLPRPLTEPINYPLGDDLDFKTYKKLNFLPLEVWQRWYQTEGFTQGDAGELIDKINYPYLQQAGTFDYKNTFKIGLLPKIAVDRTTRATNLYHTARVQFETENNRSGLYFLLYFPTYEQQLENHLYAALNLLGEEGLGGERSSGAGRFEVEWLDLSETWQQVVKFSTPLVYHCLISLFWDDEASNLEKLITDKSSYEILDRGGWITSSSGHQLRRQFVRMFAEGSVFPINPQGKLADVTPKGFTTHPIYRSGISLSLPIKVSHAKAQRR